MGHRAARSRRDAGRGGALTALAPGLTPSQTVGPYLGIGLVWGRARSPIPDGMATPASSSTARGRRAGRARRDLAGPRRRRLRAARPTTTARGACGCPACPIAGEAPHVAVNVFARGLLHHLVTRTYLSDEAEANAADPVLYARPGRLAVRRWSPREPTMAIDSTSRLQGPARPSSSTSELFGAIYARGGVRRRSCDPPGCRRCWTSRPPSRARARAKALIPGGRRGDRRGRAARRTTTSRPSGTRRRATRPRGRARARAARARRRDTPTTARRARTSSTRGHARRARALRPADRRRGRRATPRGAGGASPRHPDDRADAAPIRGAHQFGLLAAGWAVGVPRHSHESPPCATSVLAVQMGGRVGQRALASRRSWRPSWGCASRLLSWHAIAVRGPPSSPSALGAGRRARPSWRRTSPCSPRPTSASCARAARAASPRRWRTSATPWPGRLRARVRRARAGPSGHDAGPRCRRSCSAPPAAGRPSGGTLTDSAAPDRLRGGLVASCCRKLEVDSERMQANLGGSEVDLGDSALLVRRALDLVNEHRSEGP